MKIYMDGENTYSVSTYLSPLDSVVKSDADESLGTVLSLVKTSHTPVFIFNEKEKFIGLISPFNTLYKHHYPYTTKVGSIVLTPPHITERTPLYEVAEYMLSIRIYTLPVFDGDGSIKGIIRAKDIFHGIKNDKDFLKYVSATLQPNPAITTDINGTVEDVYHVMRTKGISRLVLTDDEGNVTGIIARSDLMNAFITPTPKQRFSKQYGDSGYFAFDGEKDYRREEPIRKFHSRRVDTISASASMREIVERLITSEHNSIVLVDKGNKPVGFLSTRDLLESVATLRPEEDIHLNINKPSDAVSDEEFDEAMEHLTKFAKKLHKRLNVLKIDVNFEEPKYRDGQTAIYNTSVVVTPVSGEKVIGKTQRKIFLDGIRSATDQIEKQEQRHSDMKGHHYAANV